MQDEAAGWLDRHLDVEPAWTESGDVIDAVADLDAVESVAPVGVEVDAAIDGPIVAAADASSWLAGQDIAGDVDAEIVVTDDDLRAAMADATTTGEADLLDGLGEPDVDVGSSDGPATTVSGIVDPFDVVVDAPSGSDDAGAGDTAAVPPSPEPADDDIAPAPTPSPDPPTGDAEEPVAAPDSAPAPAIDDAPVTSWSEGSARLDAFDVGVPSVDDGVADGFGPSSLDHADASDDDGGDLDGGLA